MTCSMLALLVAVNGVYDVACGLFPQPHYKMFEDIDERSLRYLGYWVFTYGMLRVASAWTGQLWVAAITYVLEAVCFAVEHTHKTTVAWRVAFVCVTSLAIAILCTIPYKSAAP